MACTRGEGFTGKRQRGRTFRWLTVPQALLRRSVMTSSFPTRPCKANQGVVKGGPGGELAGSFLGRLAGTTHFPGRFDVGLQLVDLPVEFLEQLADAWDDVGGVDRVEAREAGVLGASRARGRGEKPRGAAARRRPGRGAASGGPPCWAAEGWAFGTGGADDGGPEAARGAP